MKLSNGNNSVMLLLILIVATPAFGQLESARVKIDSLARHAKGIVGAAAVDLENGDTLTVRRDGHFPMQSVFKFPLALAVLDRVDRGSMSLTRPVHISKADLYPDMWSPLRKAYPNGNVDLPLDTLVAYSILYSDNSACDILFRLVGGPDVVNRYIHNAGINDIRITATEGGMRKGWNIQYRNWSSPLAMANLLKLFYGGKLLSQRSREYLLWLMTESNTGPNRIRGLLPAGTVVAHKTGSSGTNKKGLAAATNDVGIVTCPRGRHVALVVFVSDSNAPENEREKVIASISRAIWDAYSAP